ncbi:MAG TPA: hypothetical protein VKO67_11345 [Smithellaceae bacterium]|nr:hypothetical protein [Smithellaceae bacterium]
MKHVKRIIILFILAVVAVIWLGNVAAESSSSIEQTFQKAKQNYLDKNMEAASTQIQKGAAYMKEQSEKASDSGKAALAASSRELEELAGDVKKGSVKSVKKMEDAFARAYLALAKDAHTQSAKSWAEKQGQKAGEGLEKASGYLERSFAWAGQKVEQGTRNVMQKSKDLSTKLKEKGRAVAEDVGKNLKETGNEIEKFGKKISPK